jgi:signal transduction histidine kinase
MAGAVRAQDVGPVRRRILAEEAERQRIERNLHDGAQQRLIALRVKLAVVHDLLETESPEGAQMLAALDAELERAIEDIREVAQDLHPRLLADLGLPGALRSAARRSPYHVTVNAPDIGRYSLEVETAVHYCCLEALQNATKHAGPSAPVAIKLRDENGTLHFEVSDQGRGFDLDDENIGSGLRNMEDRISAVGGQLSIESQPGAGTRIIGTVPAGEHAEDGRQI